MCERLDVDDGVEANDAHDDGGAAEEEDGEDGEFALSWHVQF